MLFKNIFLTLLATASAVFAAPSASKEGSLCNPSRDKLSIPTATSGTPLATPTSAGPKFVAVGLGVQNYTCSSAGTFTSVGAYAELLDLSCLPEASFDTITDLVFAAWEKAPSKATAQDVVSELDVVGQPFVLGQHFFVPSPSGSGLSPKWDFTSSSEKGHSDAFVVGAKTGDIPAPSDPTTNVDWLSLSAAQGDLASQVFRVQTRGGQPPASCTPGSPEIFVRYASQYWFYGGSF